MKLNFRQKYGSVGEPGAWRSSIQLAPRAAGFLRRLAQGGKRSGVIAVAVEVLYVITCGTEPEVEECAETLAALLPFDLTAPLPLILRQWAQRCRLLARMLDLQAVAMVEALMEQEGGNNDV